MKKKLVVLSSLALCWGASVFAQQKTVTLDYYFNNEYMKNDKGVPERFHYIWEDESENGYSRWGNIFKNLGLNIKSLPVAPTKETLKGTAIYIITDPDTYKEVTTPNFVNDAHVKAISEWVKQGGVLVLMANDSSNAELPHFNKLADVFGIHFTDKVRNTVVNGMISIGRIVVNDNNPVFKTGKTLYLKGISTIAVTPPAKPLVEDKGDVIMATAKYGKGTVFAVGDPWIYNEYIVNKRLTNDFQNTEGANDISKWLVQQIPSNEKEVKKWVKGKEWANGFAAKLHECVNKDAFYKEYHANKTLWDEAFAFIKNNNLQELKPGKYPIDGDKVFASVTNDPSKDFEKTKWESHKKYIDLQYVIVGKEKMGVADASASKVINPYKFDVMNYEAEGKFYIATPENFFLFFPNDAHRPNILVDGFPTVKKLVIKIQVAE